MPGRNGPLHACAPSAHALGLHLGVVHEALHFRRVRLARSLPVLPHLYHLPDNTHAQLACDIRSQYNACLSYNAHLSCNAHLSRDAHLARDDATHTRRTTHARHAHNATPHHEERDERDGGDAANHASHE